MRRSVLEPRAWGRAKRRRRLGEVGEGGRRVGSVVLPIVLQERRGGGRGRRRRRRRRRSRLRRSEVGWRPTSNLKDSTFDVRRSTIRRLHLNVRPFLPILPAVLLQTEAFVSCFVTLELPEVVEGGGEELPLANQAAATRPGQDRGMLVWRVLTRSRWCQWLNRG